MLSDLGISNFTCPDKTIDFAVDFVTSQEKSMSSPNPMAPRMNFIRSMLNRTPWFLSKEYWDNKGGMYALSGDGDPSNGRGEGFNFARMSKHRISSHKKAMQKSAKKAASKRDWDFRTLKKTEALAKLREHGVSESEIQMCEPSRRLLNENLRRIMHEGSDCSVSVSHFLTEYNAQVQSIWDAQTRALRPENPEVTDDECDQMDLEACLEADFAADVLAEFKTEDQKELDIFRQVVDEEATSLVEPEMCVKRLKIYKLNKKSTSQCTFVFGESIEPFKKQQKKPKASHRKLENSGKIMLKISGESQSESEARGAKRASDCILSIKPAKKKLRTRKSLARLYKDLNTKITSVLRISVPKEGSVFVKPVTLESGEWAERYLSLIERPISIGCMKKKARNKEYTSLQDFLNDYQTVVDNSVTFNGVHNPLTMVVKEMQKKVKEAVRKVQLSEIELDIKSVTEDTSAPTTCPSPEHASESEVSKSHEIGGLKLSAGDFCED
jgi:hypothetical protein